MVERNPSKYKMLPLKVENLIRRGTVSLSALLDSLHELFRQNYRYDWTHLIEELITKFSNLENRLRRKRESERKREREWIESCLEIENERSKIGPIDLMGMMLAMKKGKVNDYSGNYCTAR